MARGDDNEGAGQIERIDHALQRLGFAGHQPAPLRTPT
jgi:hypothetical protein